VVSYSRSTQRHPTTVHVDHDNSFHYGIVIATRGSSTFFDYQQKVHHKVLPLSKTDEADWGDAPPEYIEEAQTMLQKSYSNLTPSEMSKMTSSFSYFYRHFVETPLSPIVENDHDNHDTHNHFNTGTFHQHYRINGFLIAVGVVDIVPEGLSSVYAFYDAEFAQSLCPLGKLLVLKEIEYCRNLNLRYYYLGDYSHSCSKLRYKAEFHPSQLLCPTTSCWVDAQDGLATLNMESERQCRRLYHGPVAVDDVEDKLDAMETVLLKVGRSNPVTLSMLCPDSQDFATTLCERIRSPCWSRCQSSVYPHTWASALIVVTPRVASSYNEWASPMR
jgi:arginine-tRNA-protein transferase